MAPSSNQHSSTATPTNPDLRQSPTPQSFPHTPATPTMNNQAPPSQAHELMMANLEQVWSSLSLEYSQDELVGFVRIPVHPRTAMVWNQVSQTPSLPLRVETPPQPTPCNRSRSNAQVHRLRHPYQTPARSSRAPPVRQRTISMSSSSAESPDPLPVAIFRFLDRSEINISMQVDEPYLYIIMFSNCSLPFMVSATHWTRLGELEALYRIKTTTTRHQCQPPPAARTPPSWRV